MKHQNNEADKARARLLGRVKTQKNTPRENSSTVWQLIYNLKHTKLSDYLNGTQQQLKRPVQCSLAFTREETEENPDEGTP